jgi:hypothetical protein
MKDMLGNTLAEGQMALWERFIVKVKEIHDGALSIAQKNKDIQQTEAYVLVELKLAVDPNKPIPLIRVVDPESEKLLHSLVGATQ